MKQGEEEKRHGIMSREKTKSEEREKLKREESETGKIEERESKERR